MGEVASIMKAVSCSDCVCYVCNAMHCNSKCRDCCKIDFVTEPTEILDDDNTYSVDIGCCAARHETHAP